MSAEAALALLGVISRTGADPWVDGGWGIDALLEQETRDHDDLDAVIAREDLDRVRDVLGNLGFAVLRNWLPAALALAHRDGREVDLHPVDGTALEEQWNEELRRSGQPRSAGPRGRSPERPPIASDARLSRPARVLRSMVGGEQVQGALAVGVVGLGVDPDGVQRAVSESGRGRRRRAGVGWRTVAQRVGDRIRRRGGRRPGRPAHQDIVRVRHQDVLRVRHQDAVGVGGQHLVGVGVQGVLRVGWQAVRVAVLVRVARQDIVRYQAVVGIGQLTPLPSPVTPRLRRSLGISATVEIAERVGVLLPTVTAERGGCVGQRANPARAGCTPYGDRRAMVRDPYG